MNSLADIKKLYFEIKQLQTELNSYLKFDLSFEEYLYVIALMSGQRRGPKLEKRIIKDIGGTKIKASLDRGDFVKNSKYCEIKTCLYTADEFEKSASSGGQMRLWQGVDYYLFCTLIETNTEISHAFFMIPKKELLKHCEVELKSQLMCSSHGVQIHSKNNQQGSIDYIIKSRVEIGLDLRRNLFDWDIYRINNIEELETFF